MIGRIGHRHCQHAAGVVQLDRQDLVKLAHRLVDQLHRFFLHAEVFVVEADDLHSLLFGQRERELVFGDELHRDGGLAGQFARLTMLIEDLPKLVVVDEAEIDEDLSDLLACDRSAPFASAVSAAAAAFAGPVRSLARRPFGAVRRERPQASSPVRRRIDWAL